MNLMTNPEGSSNIVMVDIDNDSIEKLGRRPWPRSLIAECIDKINAGEPKVIGLNIILSKHEKNFGLIELKALKKDKAKRYQKTSRMADHLRRLGNKIDAVIAKKKGKEVL